MFQRYFLAPLALLLLAAPRLTHAQTGAVGIGTSAPDASAALDVMSTSKGLLPPRLSRAQRDAIANPATGLTIYNTSTNALNVWNGTSWGEAITSATQPAVQNAPTTFAYTGGVQTYTVPTGVYSLGVDASGAQGGANSGGTLGGLGGHVVTTLVVTPGETLTLYVGGQGGTAPYSGSGGAGYNGGGQGSVNNGGGGGATDLRRSATVPSTSLADRLVVAGGGGGGSGSYTGGSGGGLSGSMGNGSPAGQGGTQAGGGTGYGAASTGTLGQGGTGNYTGGGGGYYGGGGGDAGGGGGGSGYVTPNNTSGTTLTAGTQSGSGSLTLTPGVAYAAPALSGANIVGVPGDNLGNGTATSNVNLATNKLVGNGGTTGLSISSAGVVTTDGNLNLGANQLVGNGGSNGLAVGSTGSVGIGTGSSGAAASAQLEVASTSRGFLPPRLSQAQRDAVASPATGLTIYNTSTGALNVWNGTSWTETLTTTTQPQTALAAATFGYTGGVQTYLVPSGVYTLGIDAQGGQGGTNYNGTLGGQGGRVVTTLTVTPGETLTIYVGGKGGTVLGSGQGGAGYNGGGLGTSSNGGGGGATDLRRSATVPSTSLADRLVVAGGGGGASANYNYSGSGGGGGLSGSPGGGTAPNSTPGQGGTQTAGGAGGSAGGSGTLGQGGTGDSTGGGGGYYGGGGGGSSYNGGGGSGYAAAGSTSSTTMTNGYNAGNGSLTITPGPQYATPTLSGTNFVNVPGDNLGNHTATRRLDLAAFPLVGNGGTQGLSIGSAGNVGIGTTPGTTYLLDVAGPVRFTGTGNALTFPDGTTQATAATTATGATGTGFIQNQTATAQSGGFRVSGAGTVGGLLTAGSVTVSGTATISGRVGVGTSSPASLLSSTNGNIIAADGNGTSNEGLSWASNLSIGYVGTFFNGYAPFGSSGGNGVAVKVSDASAVALDVSQGSGQVTAGSSLLRVNGNGRVGVGFGSTSITTTSLGHPLVVQADGNNRLLGFNDASGSDKYNFSRQAATGSGTSAVPGGLNLSESGVAGGRLFVQDGGNVGIGTTNPTQRLDVSGGLLVRGNSAISNQGAYLQWNRNNGDGFTWLLNQQGGGAGGIVFGSVTTANSATEWARFDGSGNLGIGMTPGAKLDVAGQVRANGVVLTSDQRLKQAIRPLTGALASVLALRGVRYEWNALGVRRGGTAGAGQVGVIAQEVERIYPELVSTGADGYKAVNYAQLTPVLLEALKEQQQQIEALKQQNAAAHAELQTVKAQATADKVQATATLETFEARLRRLEAGTAQAQR